MFALCLLIGSLVVLATGEIESNFYREESCAAAKGYCVLEKECQHPVEKEYQSLCASQKKDGAVCCKDFPESEVNCNQQHNSCMATCPDSLNQGRKGCPEGHSCCVLVH